MAVEITEQIADLSLNDDSRIVEFKEKQEIKDIALALECKAKGNDFFKTGQFDDAIDEYSKAISFCPEDNENLDSLSIFYGNRSAAYFSEGDYDECISDCSKALELKPDYVKVLARRSQAYEKRERLEDAIQGG